MGKRKSVLTLVFLILTLGVAMVGRNVIANFTPVLPSDNIIIEADGRVTGTDKIMRNGDTYTFIGNVSGTKTIQGNMVGNISCALAIHKSNIIIDGAGFTLQGNDITGIDISNGVCQGPSEKEIWNVTVKNLRITNCSLGIQCVSGGNHTFYGNYISNDYVTQNGTGNLSWDNLGIAFWGSSGNNITHCTIGGSPAIYMHFTCVNNIVTENNIVFGVNLAISGDETFDRNYWGDYSTKYPSASEVVSSGVWSIPYAFADSQNKRTFQDNHPLVNPLVIPIFSSALPTIVLAQQSSIMPILLVVSIFAVIVAVAMGLFVYFKKRK